MIKHKKILSKIHQMKYSSCADGFKVAIAGASGGIGQPLALLMKLNPFVKELSLYDIQLTPGVSADLSHIDTPSKVKGLVGSEAKYEALKDADVIIIPAGIPRKPGMTREDLFKTNAGILKEIMEVGVEVAPKALFAIITNPVNSMVPIACEVMKKANKFNPERVFGVTTLDVVRSNTFVAEILNINPKEVNVPVIGGHSGITIIPVFSRSQPCLSLDDEEVRKLTKKVQDAGTEVVKAKAGSGSATLSMAYAGARFANSLMRGLSGEDNVVECSYVATSCGETPYFASPIVLGAEGLKQDLGPGELNKFEAEQVKLALPELLKNIKTGEEFVNKSNNC